MSFSDGTRSTYPFAGPMLSRYGALPANTAVQRHVRSAHGEPKLYRQYSQLLLRGRRQLRIKAAKRGRIHPRGVMPLFDHQPRDHDIADGGAPPAKSR